MTGQAQPGPNREAAAAPNGGSDPSGQAVETAEDLPGLDGVEPGMSVQGRIEMGRISTMVLLMMDSHGPRVYVGLKGVVGISKLRQMVRSYFPLSLGWPRFG